MALIFAVIVRGGYLKLKNLSLSISGVVPKPTGKVAQNGEMLGTVDHNGRVRTLRGHGPPLAAIAGHDRQIGQGERMRRPLVARYVLPSVWLIIIHLLIIIKSRLINDNAILSVDKEMTR